MDGITAILSAFRRPQTLASQMAALRAQSVRAQAIWLWANEPDEQMREAIDRERFDRAVLCSQNAYVHARFALALSAPSPYVAIFDDDTIPGPEWLENCLETMRRQPAILGSAGVRLQGHAYSPRAICGWHDPSDDSVEVDLVGHAWFLRTEWVHYLFSAPAVTGTNGEDIELSSRAWRLGGIRTFCPPHPPRNLNRWGSLEGSRLGIDPVAASRRKEHLAERDRIVQAEIEHGWRPLFLRNGHAGGANGHSSVIVGAAPPGAPVSKALTAASPQIARASPARADLAGSDISQLVPTAAGRILLLGFEINDIAKTLRERQPEMLRMIELASGPHREAKQENLQHSNLAIIEGGLPAGPWDCVVCVDLLDRLREPPTFLRRLHDNLAPGGSFVASVPNLRHHSTISSLLAGKWPFRSDGLVPDDPIRFFTRRELEKLLFRGGFQVQELRPAAGPELDAWQRAGRPSDVNVGSLHIGGLSATEAEEFYSPAYVLSATPRAGADYGLTSIVLVTHNQLAYTHGCLESIRYRTDEPYELILVDNGSSDATVEYLRACRDVRLIVNAENRGFPAAANQGIEASQGRQIVLLNNDTVVTTGWLHRLLYALHKRDDVGIVGPCTNYISGPQQVAVSYQDLADLDGFAWDWGKSQEGAAPETERLVGFCLAMRREVVDRIGKLDERFGIGNFEDDDYCLRARQAGFRTLIAQDSFVHHFGHRSFAGAGVDLSALLETNERIFRQKWGAPAPNARAEPVLPRDSSPSQESCPGATNGAAVAPAPPAPRPRYAVAPAEGRGLLLVRQTQRLKLSLCMIVRDNEGTIRPCLESIRPWVDETIVVDTGSQDSTPQICRELGAAVYHFPWCDDFAAARNESLKYAGGEWIFWMDSDDTISPENGRKLRELVQQPAAANLLGYVVQVYCPDPGDDSQSEVTVVDHVKLFRNLPNLRFEGRIHEQILSAIRAAGGEVAWTDLYVTHSGADHTPEGRQRKLERDLRLLDLDLAERPEHAFVLFNLGMTHADGKDYPAAIEALDRCLAVSQPQESHVRKAYALLVSSYYQMARYDEAWGMCQRGRRHYPQDLELLFREGMLHHQFGRLQEAVAAYQQVLNNQEERHFTSIDRGIRGFKARHNLAVVYTDLGWLRLAEQQWREILREIPTYRPGWQGLRQNLVAQASGDELARVADRLLSDERLKGEGLLCRAEKAKTKGDWVTARQDLAAAVGCSPANDHEALRSWCQFLFEHGDPQEARSALQQLAERCPNDPGVRHNLGTIQLQLKHPDEAVTALKESLRLRRDSAFTWLHLGYAYRELKRTPDAVAAWREALRLQPDYAAARQALTEWEGGRPTEPEGSKENP